MQFYLSSTSKAYERDIRCLETISFILILSPKSLIHLAFCWRNPFQDKKSLNSFWSNGSFYQKNVLYTRLVLANFDIGMWSQKSISGQKVVSLFFNKHIQHLICTILNCWLIIHVFSAIIDTVNWSSAPKLDAIHRILRVNIPSFHRTTAQRKM